MAVFWDVVPCSLVETDRRLRGAYSAFIIRAVIVEELNTPEILVYLYQSTRHNIP
jgi:hypothetical protein